MKDERALLVSPESLSGKIKKKKKKHLTHIKRMTKHSELI